LANRPVQKIFSLRFELPEYVEGSYICVPLEGKHGIEGAYAGLKCFGYVVVEDPRKNIDPSKRITKTLTTINYIGAPSRATSYPSNAWEAGVRRNDSNYTYFIPVTEDMIGKTLEVVVLAMDKDNVDFVPSAWITANPIPMVKKQLVLTRK
jgi:hypothetical protein